MGENPIRFGIVGCAEIARKVARAINLAPNSTVYAIASRSLDKALNFASTNGLQDTVKIHSSYDQILDDACVDALYIPLPTSLHLHWAILAAKKKKHILLEKPTALNIEELDQILDACELNGVQFMDGSMWLHHPRTAKMKQLICEPKIFGHVNYIHSTSTMSGTSQFLEDNIRVKPDLDALGALGDLAWYCIGAILWAKDYELPTQVRALPDFTKNSAGVILSCTASFLWGQSSSITTATIHCSFLSHTSMDIALSGSRGSLHVYDFIIPFQETSASFDFNSSAKFADLHVGWNTKPEDVEVANELPQEALMVKEFARLAQAIRTTGSRPDSKWPQISRKTQLVMDAVKKSIDSDCKTVYL